jgi:hypothetical protein
MVLMADDDGVREISELVNCVTWTAAIIDKALPLNPFHTEREHQDRAALRQIAFGILMKEQLRYEFRASPDYLLSLLPATAR